MSWSAGQESGVGFVQPGSLLVATTDGRWEEIRRGASMASLVGRRASRLLDRDGVGGHVATDEMSSDVRGAAFLPADGVASPSEVTHALAAAREMAGARVFEQTRVDEVVLREGRVTGVRTDRGDIACEYVVNCTGMWVRELGAARRRHPAARRRALLPGHRAIEALRGPAGAAPPDDATYVRNEAGKLMVGFFEPGAKPWATDGSPPTPSSSPCRRTGTTWSHGSSARPAASRSSARWASSSSSTAPSTSPGRPLRPRRGAGPARLLRRGGLQLGRLRLRRRRGRAVADWLVDGAPRWTCGRWTSAGSCPSSGTAATCTSADDARSLGLLYDDALAVPADDDVARHPALAAARPPRGARRLLRRGRRLGARQLVRADGASTPRYEYSTGARTGSRRRRRAPRRPRGRRPVRPDIVRQDPASQGRDAEAVLQRVCAGDVAVEPGRIVYTPMLNARGGIESDVTVTRLDETRFLVVTTGTSTMEDLDWLAAPSTRTPASQSPTSPRPRR